MKKLILLSGLFLFAIAAVFGQTNKEEIELYQSVFGMEKKAAVSEFIKLEGEQATAFWALYDEYETARKVNGQKRINLMSKYVDSYLDLDDTKTDELVAESIKINNEQSKLIQKYYKSMKKVAGSKAAAQFLQLENYFQSVIRITLMEGIPFIGELDN